LDYAIHLSYSLILFIFYFNLTFTQGSSKIIYKELKVTSPNDSTILSEIKKSYSRQIGAAFKMLENVINNANDTTWTSRLNNMPFWQICYHVLWYTDFYFHANQETFRPQSFDMEGIKNYWIKPDSQMIENQKHPISKKDMLFYCNYGRQKAQQFIDGIDVTYFTTPSPFEWHGFPKIDIVDYNIRHLQHHIGQLDIILRREQDIGNPWIMFDDLLEKEGMPSVISK
jgi:hypothetical protein